MTFTDIPSIALLLDPAAAPWPSSDTWAELSLVRPLQCPQIWKESFDKDHSQFVSTSIQTTESTVKKKTRKHFTYFLWVYQMLSLFRSHSSGASWPFIQIRMFSLMPYHLLLLLDYLCSAHARVVKKLYIQETWHTTQGLFTPRGRKRVHGRWVHDLQACGPDSTSVLENAMERLCSLDRAEVGWEGYL